MGFAREWNYSILLIAAVFLVAFANAARAEGPSFDCAKAATSVERTICADAGLSALDRQLAQVLRAALTVDPARRDALLQSSRQWIAQRDKRCATADAGCLAEAYRARIAALGAEAPSASAALCNHYVEIYRKWLEAAGPQAAAAGPLAVASAKDSGVAVADPISLYEESPTKLQDWARRRRPPIVLPRAIADAFTDDGQWTVFIEQAPGHDYYAATTVRGTAHCISAVYFTVEAGKARFADAPPAWPGQDVDVCGLTRSFGTVDGAAVAIQDDTSFGPNLSSDLSISPWVGAGFGPACSIRFDYEPRFSTDDLAQDWPHACSGPRCDALSRTAMALAKDVQEDPVGARRRALDRLSPPERARFEKANPAQP